MKRMMPLGRGKMKQPILLGISTMGSYMTTQRYLSHRSNTSDSRMASMDHSLMISVGLTGGISLSEAGRVSLETVAAGCVLSWMIDGMLSRSD
jgi:hypothetical protein